MNRVINVKEYYKPQSDTLATGLMINLKNGKQVYAIFEHDNNEQLLISNEEIINKLRALAEHIETNHNA